MPDIKFEIRLGPEGGTLEFDNFDLLVDWFNTEANKWGWINAPDFYSAGYAPTVNMQNYFIRAVGDQIRQLKNSIQIARNAGNVMPDLNSTRELIANESFNFYSNRRGIYSESPRGKFVFKLKAEKSPLIAVAAIAQFIKVNPPQPYEGTIAAALFESGLGGTFEAQRTALTELHIEWQGKFNALKKDYDEKIATNNTAGEAAKTLLNTRKEDFQKLFDDSTKKKDELKNNFDTGLKSIMEQTDRECKTLKDTMASEIALRAPAQYWRDKAREYRNFAIVYGIASILVIAMVLFGMWFLIATYLMPPPNDSNPNGWKPQPWQFAVVIPAAFFGIWIVKIFVKLFQNNIQFYTDAKERVVLVTTYLALVNEDKINRENEIIILQSLFRSSSAGTMKDDGLPLSVVDILLKSKAAN